MDQDNNPRRRGSGNSSGTNNYEAVHQVLNRGVGSTAVTRSKNARSRSQRSIYPDLKVDWLVQFRDVKLDQEYRQYLKINRHSKLKWLLYMVAAFLWVPIVIQGSAIAGTHGLVVLMSQVCLLVTYVFIFLVSTSTLTEEFWPASLKDHRQHWKSALVLFSILCSSLSLFCRTRGSPCLPDESLQGLQFCNASQNGLIPSDGFVSLMATHYFYMHLLPVPYSWNMLCWAVGLAGTLASIYSAVTVSAFRNAWLGNLLLLSVYLCFPILTYRQERKHMRYFLCDAGKANPRLRLTKAALDAFNAAGAIGHVIRVGGDLSARLYPPSAAAAAARNGDNGNGNGDEFDDGAGESSAADSLLDSQSEVSTSYSTSTSRTGSSSRGSSVSTATFEKYWQIKQPIPPRKFRSSNQFG